MRNQKGIITNKYEVTVSHSIMVEPFYWLNVNNKRVQSFGKQYLLNGKSIVGDVKAECLNKNLDQRAWAQSEDMAHKKYFAHEGAGGSS